MTTTRPLVLSPLFATLVLTAAAQDPAGPVPKLLLDTVEWRCIGPYRGGRVSAVAGIPGQRDTYYFGGCGGGVFKTTDGGKSWLPVSDEAFGGSIGAVEVSLSNPDVVYVGTGESTVRGNVSSGDGMWKSTDAGKTWQHVGLADSRHICRIRVDPKDPNLVYAAALGHISGRNEERGLFRSKDGGTNWERVLFANDAAGAFEVCFEPGNPKTIYASTWRVIRLPWALESGGEGSALWKSTDGGDSWQELSKNEGFPKSVLGVIGISTCPSKPDRVYAMVEAEEGGLCRSEDGGKTWRRVNSERELRQRAWYYSRCYADPKDADVVYVLNVNFHKSTDGGRTFKTISTPHVDNHDLWIDPADPKRMIEGNDGGANVSYDGGATWSSIENQPTAQFYWVTTDNSVPYRVYGAQQDNSTVRIRSRSDRGAITAQDWEPTAGGESGWLAPKPDDPEQVYGGSYGGFLGYVNHKTSERRSVNPWPDNPLGDGAIAQKYRFQWTFPIFFSPHDSNVIYSGANVLFRSRDAGQSWQAISPDLTRNDADKLQSSGGPITKDNTGVEVYCTIFAGLESPLEKGVLWAGTDDGRVHVSRDAGGKWQDVTPKDIPEWMQINKIAAHPFSKGGVYVAGTRYKLDDFRPYLWVTTDYGASWREITGGIEPNWFTRTICADPVKQGLIYCGTERMVYVSFDDGRRWQALRQNMPIVPITDLCVRDDELVAATQGRSFWILNGLGHLRQCNAAQAQAELHLFQPAPAQLAGGGGGRRGGRGAATGGSVGQNPAGGPELRFLVAGEAEAKIEDEVALEFFDGEGKSLARYSNKGKKREERARSEEGEGERPRPPVEEDDKAPKFMEVKPGMNRFVWDGRLPGAKGFEGMVLWSGLGQGPLVPPGKYRAKLQRGDKVAESEVVVQKDPRWAASEADLQARYRFVVECRDLLTRTHEGITRLRSVKKGVDAVLERAKGMDGEAELKTAGKALQEKLTAVEETLYQTKSKSNQDMLNFPIRLNDKLAALMNGAGGSAAAPTAQAVQVKQQLSAAIEAELKKLDALLTNEVKAFNLLAANKGVPHVK